MTKDINLLRDFFNTGTLFCQGMDVSFPLTSNMSSIYEKTEARSQEPEFNRN